jgi:glycerol-3-phosphate dehydrogenase
MSRGHAVYDHEKEEGLRGMITMVGGKLTTARAFAAQTLQMVGARLGRPPARRVAREGWSAGGIAPRLARIYGWRARQIVALGGEWDRPICPSAETTAAEVLHAVRNEKARTLGDILLRRTGAAFGPCLGLDCAPEAARIAAPLLGWDEQAIDAAVAAYRDELDRTLYRGLR